jgi:fructose/tagatose bisphosphate aldolase
VLARDTSLPTSFHARGQAWAAITTYTLESTAAICRSAERAGVAKVNLNAEIRRAYMTSLGTALPGGGDDIRHLQQEAVSTMSRVAYRKIMLLCGQQSGLDGEA